MKSVYIAGRSGTSGLVLHSLVQQRQDLRLLSTEVQGRAALERETDLLNAADVAILCLPPAVVKETLASITNPDVRVIDNSTSHSVADGWLRLETCRRGARSRATLSGLSAEAPVRRQPGREMSHG